MIRLRINRKLETYDLEQLVTRIRAGNLTEPKSDVLLTKSQLKRIEQLAKQLGKQLPCPESSQPPIIPKCIQVPRPDALADSIPPRLPDSIQPAIPNSLPPRLLDSIQSAIPDSIQPAIPNMKISDYATELEIPDTNLPELDIPDLCGPELEMTAPPLVPNPNLTAHEYLASLWAVLNADGSNAKTGV